MKSSIYDGRRVYLKLLLSFSYTIFFSFTNNNPPLRSRYARPWGMHPDAAAAQASKRGSGNEKLITFFGGAVSAVFEVRQSIL